MTQHTMSAPDTAWLHMGRRTNPMVINSVLWFDEPLDWDATREVFMERMVKRFPRFRQRVVEGRLGYPPSWQDDREFEPRLHFHRRALPAPGDQAVLQEVVSDLVTAPLDGQRPMWDVYLLEGFGAGCALMVRMHHAIADGIALARVLLSVTDAGGPPSDFEEEHRAPAPASSGRTARHLAGAVASGGVKVLRDPSRLGAIGRAAVDDARALAKFLVPGADTPTRLRGELVAGHHVAWSKPVSLATVKRAARSLDATINDVIVAGVAGAVGAHLREHGEAADELHALVPVNLRPLDQPLPRELGNRFGLLLLSLPVGIADPLARVDAVTSSMKVIKHSHEGLIVYSLLGLIGRTPEWVERMLVDYFSAKGTMVLTNVPGPRSEVTLAGTPVAGVLVWAPCSGSVGMSVGVFSYAGKVSAGFLVDDAVVENPQRLADGFRDELLRIARHARAVTAA
jgi:WS/DGAT/MGAT family acyltransferase